LRDTQTYEPLPGVECGDIGPKFGYATKDNGYLILKNVRIPRDNLLRRFVNVDREGNYTVKGDLRSLYSVMMFIRVTLALFSGKALA
jgi:acyl-CoA oxidase